LAGEFGEENVRKAFLNADLEEHGMMPLLEPLTLFDALYAMFPK